MGSKRREIICICGSGKPARLCCYRYKVWHKPPSLVTPKLPRTEESNQKCYLSFSNDCTQDISREHYISEGVLRTIGGKFGLPVSGLHWLKTEGDNQPYDALASKILCARHNNALSPLDSEMMRFSATLKDFQQNEPDASKPLTEVLFSGDDIEKWLLKTVCSMAAAGNIRNKKEKLLSTPEKPWLKILYGRKSWPQFWGLYVVEIPMYTAPSFEFIPSSVIETVNPKYNLGDMLSVNMALHGLQFKLVLYDTGEPKEHGIHRPPHIVMRRNRTERVLTLSWSKGTHSPSLLLDHSGPGDPVPPHWPDWAKKQKG